MRKANTFILKITSRCNIACKYCYMYFRGDDSILGKQKRISFDTVKIFTDRLNSHCRKYDIDKIIISLHGGEPLLVGKDYFSQICSLLMDIDVDVSLKVQSNGILIDYEWLKIFHKYDVMIGVSLDGNETINDKNRIYSNGRGTYQQVVSGIQKLQQSHEKGDVTFAGVISVIDPNQDPVEFYEHCASDLKLNSFNVLFPDSNHDNYWKYNSASPDDYGDYLVKLYDHWSRDDRCISISFFNSIVSLIQGGNSKSETVGSMGSKAVVIDVDGEIECHDVLRMNGHHNQIPLNIKNNEISELGASTIFQLSDMTEFPKDSSVKCKECPVFSFCKGGFYGHRYSSHNGYMNHNVFCNSLFKIIDHIYFDLLDKGSEIKQVENNSIFNYAY